MQKNENVSVSVTYESNGGTGSPVEVKVPSFSDYNMPSIEDVGFTAPEGQEFGKWHVTFWGVVNYTLDDHIDGMYSQGEKITITDRDDVPLTATALWKDKYYDVTFVMNSADDQEPAQKVKHGYPVKKPFSYSHKKGATFVNWYTDPSLEDEFIYDFNDPAPVTSDMKLYAGWGKYVGAYTYNNTMKSVLPRVGLVKADDSKWAVSSAILPLFGKTVTLSARPDKAGYKFVGWSPAKSIIEPTGEIVNTDPEWSFKVEEGKSHDFFAMFEKVKIYYDTRRDGVIGPLYVDDNGIAPKPSNSAVFDSNGSFYGWYTDETFTEVFDRSKPLTEDTTVYARCVATSRAGIYDRAEKKQNSGGKVKYKNDPQYYTRMQYDYKLDGEKETVCAEPDEGYVFIGWSKGSPEGEIVSTEKEYEFTTEYDNLYYAVFDKKPSYSYISGNDKKEVTQYTVLNDATTELTNGWYVVSEDLTSDHRLTVKGDDVNLLIPDGVTFKAPKGITVTDDSGFNVWSESRVTEQV